MSNEQLNLKNSRESLWIMGNSKLNAELGCHDAALKGRQNSAWGEARSAQPQDRPMTIHSSPERAAESTVHTPMDAKNPIYLIYNAKTNTNNSDMHKRVHGLKSLQTKKASGQSS